MKKLLLLLILSYETISLGSNLCIGHVGRRFRKHAPIVLNSHEDERIACNCNCYQQPRSRHEHGHKCLKCDHRLLPHDVEKQTKVILTPEAENYINAWKQNTFIRDVEQTVEQVIEQEIEEIQKLRN